MFVSGSILSFYQAMLHISNDVCPPPPPQSEPPVLLSLDSREDLILWKHSLQEKVRASNNVKVRDMPTSESSHLEHRSEGERQFPGRRLVVDDMRGVAQSVERATPVEEVLGSIPAVAVPCLLVGSVSEYCDQLRQKSWSPRSVSCVAACKIDRRPSWDASAI